MQRKRKQKQDLEKMTRPPLSYSRMWVCIIVKYIIEGYVGVHGST